MLFNKSLYTELLNMLRIVYKTNRTQEKKSTNAVIRCQNQIKSLSNRNVK